MTVKVEDTLSANLVKSSESNKEEVATSVTASVATASIEATDDSNNNQNTSQNSSLDSVVQRLIHKKMGRRKQNCPQRTGNLSEEGKPWPFWPFFICFLF